MLNYKFKGYTQLLDALNKTAQKLGANIPDVTVDTLMGAALAEAKKRTPVHKPNPNPLAVYAPPWTGHLKEGWQIFKPPQWKHTAILRNLYSFQDPARRVLGMLEGGTRAHAIAPIPPNTRLRFFLKDGAMCFAKSVKHPGTKAYAMVKGAKARVAALLAQAKEAAEEMAVKEFEKGK